VVPFLSQMQPYLPFHHHPFFHLQMVGKVVVLMVLAGIVEEEPQVLVQVVEHLVLVQVLLVELLVVQVLLVELLLVEVVHLVRELLVEVVHLVRELLVEVEHQALVQQVQRAQRVQLLDLGRHCRPVSLGHLAVSIVYVALSFCAIFCASLP